MVHQANNAGSCLRTDKWNSAVQDLMTWDKGCLLLCDRPRVGACSPYAAELPLHSRSLITAEEALSAAVRQVLLLSRDNIGTS